MTGAFRLRTGGRVERSEPLSFSFDGRPLTGLAGDTLASALIANGIHLVGRSFKYHRPRGILAAGSDEPNALVTAGRDAARLTPNLRATQVELHDGLIAKSQNRWPGLGFDLGAVNDALAPLLPAGFYYKTFMWPPALWTRLYEPLIRRAAGLGVAPAGPDPDRYTQVHAHCDVLVVGAGPAGLAAALAASRAGARVIFCDEQAEPGGSLLHDREAVIDGRPADAWIAGALAELAATPDATLLRRTTCFGWYPHNHLGLVERVTDHIAAPDPKLPRERLWQVRARDVVLATGALERPLVFPGNDRPGVMLAEAARIYAVRYAARPGARAVVVTACDSAYRAALDLKEAGVEIALIADLRNEPPGPWPARARTAGIDVRTGWAVTGTRGRKRIRSATLAPLAGGGSLDVACDLLLMSGGFTPSVHLFSQSRGKPRWAEDLQAFVPGEPAERERSAGACRGVFGLADVLADGDAAGRAGAQAAGFAPPSPRGLRVEAEDAVAGGFIGAVPGAETGRAFVDFQNDVTAKDIRLATREGFRAIEHVKRYTTTGMATDQGKTSNLNALGIAAAALGASVPEVGLTTFRPPYTPTTFGVFAGAARGELFDPVRTTPIHGWAEARGAVFEDVGQWKRAHYYRLLPLREKVSAKPTDEGSTRPLSRSEAAAGGKSRMSRDPSSVASGDSFSRRGRSDVEDMHAAVARECRAVRERAGLFDASTLGKIEVVGPDAATFLDRLYVNAFSSLAPGRLRYGLMLREDGFVMDDGVVGRLAPDRFHVTTTTGGAARVLHHMEDYLQTEWPELKVWLTTVTEQWATIAVQGPRARDILAPLVEGVDLSPSAMPHMSLREGRIGDIPMRLFRVSFTGELGYEVNVPAGHGRAVWEAIAASGERFGAAPYGTEAMHVLRAEKGYIIVGQESDGTATPDDLGLGWMVGKAKRDFVGKRSQARAAMAAPGRKQLVGLLTIDGETLLEEGAQIVADPRQTIPMTMLGHVTSSYRSAAVGRPIALAMLRGGRARMGERLWVPMPGRDIEVEVVAPVFYDPAGERLHG